MSDTAVIEAPPAQEQSPSQAAQGPMSELQRAAAMDGRAAPDVTARFKAESEASRLSAQDLTKRAQDRQTEIVHKPVPDAKPAEKTAVEKPAVEKEKPAAKKVELAPDDKTKKPWEKLESPAAKEAVKDVAPDADEDTILPKGLDEKGGARWKELKIIEKQFKAQSDELSSLKKQIAEGEAGKSEMTLKELESLRKEKAEIEQLVAEKKLERSKEFQETVTAKVKEGFDVVDSIVKGTELDARAMDEAIGIKNKVERNRAIAKLLDGLETPLNQMDVTTLYDAAKDLHAAWDKEAELRTQAREIETAADAKVSASSAQAEKAKAEEWSKASDAMFDTLAAKLPMLKDPDMARQVRENSVRSEDVMDQAYRAQAGALFPHIVRERNEFAARIEELESVIADLHGSKPSLDGQPEQIKQPSQLETMTPSEAARYAGG